MGRYTAQGRPPNTWARPPRSFQLPCDEVTPKRPPKATTPSSRSAVLPEKLSPCAQLADFKLQIIETGSLGFELHDNAIDARSALCWDQEVFRVHSDTSCAIDTDCETIHATEAIQKKYIVVGLPSIRVPINNPLLVRCQGVVKFDAPASREYNRVSRQVGVAPPRGHRQADRAFLPFFVILRVAKNLR